MGAGKVPLDVTVILVQFQVRRDQFDKSVALAIELTTFSFDSYLSLLSDVQSKTETYDTSQIIGIVN